MVLRVEVGEPSCDELCALGLWTEPESEISSCPVADRSRLDVELVAGEW